MKVFVNTEPGNRIYHFDQCVYAYDLPVEWTIEMSKHEAEHQGYHECPYCGGMSGFYMLNLNGLRAMERRTGIRFTYVDETMTLYIRTEYGFWKIYQKENGKYILLHLNCYDPEAAFDDLVSGKFHLQRDAKATDSVWKLIRYVEDHDKAKPLLLEDYRKLPQHSRKQKKYYKIAEKKAKRMQTRRVWQLFEELERDTNLKELSYC